MDLLRHRFPCKIGGRPVSTPIECPRNMASTHRISVPITPDDACDSLQAWLDPLQLPNHQQLACPITGQVMQFLLQIYCPIDANPDDAFHRSIYLFISPTGDHLATPGAVKALRCQLPRVNPFYSDQPAKESDLLPKALEVRRQVRGKARAAQLQGAASTHPWALLNRQCGFRLLGQLVA
jgi:pre-rRNA-processing protein TSR4